MTLSLTKAFANTWLAQASYTASWLRGNYAGLFRPETNQLDPNGNSDFDLRSLLANRTGNLPADRTHNIKIFASKDFLLPADQIINVGLSFNSRSGAPLDYLGRHPIYGRREVYILPRGSGGRGDWVHNFDTHIGYGIRLAKQSVLTLNIDIFNLFNFQAATSRDQEFTRSNVLPISEGKTTELPDVATNTSGKLRNSDGTPFNPQSVNPNFLNPTAFQEPRQFRFGAKVTF